MDRDLRTATVLIVDDEQPNIDLLTACLEEEGYDSIVGTRDPTQVVSLYEQHEPDIILLDLHMPKMDGFAVLEALNAVIPDDEYLPVLVLTADVTQATKQRALSGGANDFLTKPLELTEVVLRIRNLLQTRFLHEHQRLARVQAEAAERRANVLARASHVLATSFDYHTTISMLCRTLVPDVADYCVIDVLQDDGRISREGVAHVTPEHAALLENTEFAQPDLLPADHPAVVAIREGRRTLATHITPDMVDIATANSEHRRLVEMLQPRSLIAAPLLASGTIQGALVMVYSESGRHYEEADLELGCELARRTATTIENARLFDRAQQATQARDEMLAIVAHDLRNPLSTITMGSSLLIEAATTDSQKRHAELVRRAADRMRALIEDLLEVRRIESGKLKLHLRPERVGGVVNEAVGMLSPLASARGIDLCSALGESLPIVTFDSARILQVLSNLVGNALKFTPEGGRVVVSCEDGGEEVRFSVADTGPGIPREQLPHVFGRFWQASDSDSRGIGLGLSIVRGIVERHGGRVWVESELGHGATFYFTVPVRPASAEAGADDTAEVTAGVAE